MNLGQKNVRLMIDAEQTNFQPAINYMTIFLSRKYNCGEQPPIIFNTFQMYLRNGLENLKEELDRSKKENWNFAAKLVRGAYLVCWGF